MLLGDLIGRLGEGTAALDALSAMDDSNLLSAAEKAAATDGLPLGAWVREAVGRFAASADDERWLGLLGACRSTLDPGSAALRYMLNAILGTGTSAGAPATSLTRSRT